jgi:hypothetical protein
VLRRQRRHARANVLSPPGNPRHHEDHTLDAQRFDTLLRSLSVAASRRGTLAAGLSGTLGLLRLAPPHDAAAKPGKCKPKCGECEKCKKGDCEKKNGKRVCKKGRCRAKAEGAACSAGTCQDGICTAPILPPVDPLAGTCTATQEDLCQELDVVASNCNDTVGCNCFTRTNNTRFCGVDNDAYCLGPGENVACTSDADCLGDDACVKILAMCNGCGPNNDEPFCIPPCDS